MRKIRVLVGKPGLDGHDRGAKVVAAALRDAGMEVIYTGLHQTPEQVVEAALQEDVDVVALSILSGAHMTLFPEVLDLMKERGIAEKLLTGGGIIPPEDIKALSELGIGQLFGPGASTQDIAAYIRGWCVEHFGQDAFLPPPTGVERGRASVAGGSASRRASARKKAAKPARKKAVRPARKKAVRPARKKAAKPARKKAAKPARKKAVRRAAPKRKPAARRHKKRKTASRKVASRNAAKKRAPARRKKTVRASSRRKTAARRPSKRRPARVKRRR